MTARSERILDHHIRVAQLPGTKTALDIVLLPEKVVRFLRTVCSGDCRPIVEFVSFVVALNTGQVLHRDVIETYFQLPDACLGAVALTR